MPARFTFPVITTDYGRHMGILPVVSIGDVSLNDTMPIFDSTYGDNTTMKVFWSWQSDSLEKNNHFFVRDALTLALKQVADDLDLAEAERPEIDHDTKGEQGSVSIVDTIFEKINQSAPGRR